MENYQAIFIQLAIKNQALRFGEFTLKSGRISPYFFNMGALHDGKTLNLLGECYAHALKNSQLPFDVLFGPAYKGIPLVAATTMALARLYNLATPYCFNRKEAKDHGEGGELIGAPLSGNIVIIDDVITKGTAITQAMTYLNRTASATLAGVLVALDRQEKGTQNLSACKEIEKNYHTAVVSIITLAELITYLSEEKTLRGYLEKMQAYQQQYGV